MLLETEVFQGDTTVGKSIAVGIIKANQNWFNEQKSLTTTPH